MAMLVKPGRKQGGRFGARVACGKGRIGCVHWKLTK